MSGAVVTLGEPIVALLPEAPVPFSEDALCRWSVGGAELNVAVGLRRLLVDAHLIARVGDDPLGRMVTDHLRAEGMATDGIVVDPDRPTACYLREWLPDGERRLTYHRTDSAGSRLCAADVVLPEATPLLLHLTGITPALSQSAAEAVEAAIEQAAALGVPISFDPNFRPRLWSADTARPVLHRIARRCDVLMMSEDDRDVLFPGRSDDDAVRDAVAMGARVVVLKRGAAGAVATDGGPLVAVPADHVDHPVDPVGAGDAFDAAFLAAHLDGLPLDTCLRWGAFAGARVVERPGEHVSAPHRHQLERLDPTCPPPSTEPA